LEEQESHLPKQIHEGETRLRSLELHIGDLHPGNLEGEDIQEENNSFAVEAADHNWGRDEVNPTSTPAPSDILL